MTSTLLARTVRQPLVWLAITAMVIFGALFLLESGGSSAPPKVIPIHLTGNGHGQGHGNDKNGDGVPDHCTDGHGQDGVHNPHCRPASGGQT